MIEKTEAKQGQEDPVQVFILMGQSNMLGFGSVSGPDDKKGTLEYLMNKEGKYKELKDEETGKWFQSKTVRYVGAMMKKDQFGVQTNEWLTVKSNKKFGPELGFGRVMGSYYESTAEDGKKPKRVLILKCCIGNRSLGWDLLPPGSSRFEENGRIYAGYKDRAGDWDAKDAAPKAGPWYGGKQYDMDTKSAKTVLKDIGKYVPGATKYEIQGFVWWQGHKDTSSQAHTNKYEENLVRLIHILRLDFNAPKAKFVCATLGFNGEGQKGNFLSITNSLLAVSNGGHGKYPYFEGNVKTVDARSFWRGKEQSPVDQHHHYNQNGETFYEVGKALGEAMVELLQ